MHEIESTLAELVGQPLTEMWRYAGRQVLEFAPSSLVLSCDWQLWHGIEIVLASTDFCPERRDGDAGGFYDMLATQPPSVEQLTVLEKGALRLSLSSGHVVEVIPTAWVGDDSEAFLPGEQWRFLTDSSPDEQLVITTSGYEFIDGESFTALVAQGMRARKPTRSP